MRRNAAGSGSSGASTRGAGSRGAARGAAASRSRGASASRSSAAASRGSSRSGGVSRSGSSSSRGDRAQSAAVMSPLRRVARRPLTWLSVLLLAFSLLSVIARSLPADWQALPYVPMVISITPWCALVALLSLLCALIARRRVVALLAAACAIIEIWWQAPFFLPLSPLPQRAVEAVAAASANTADGYARVMTCNVYKGRADAKAIVEAVRDQRVEVLALQETTDDFVQRLNDAGIERYLPYAHVASSDGVFGNGVWSATPMDGVADDEVNSIASFMPAGTVRFNDGKTRVRFVSVHTTSPVPGYWAYWKRSLDELGRLRSRNETTYVFMGDFNATWDHASFREFLGDRFQDATRLSGHGFTFTWPADRAPIPEFAGIDHIVLDRGMRSGQMQVLPITGSDHAALLATIAVN